MAEKRMCSLCSEPLENLPIVHDLVKCEKSELLKGRIEIKRLKKSIKDWINSWYDLREIISNLWINHPAIDNDEKRAYYQNNLRNFSEVKTRIANGKCTNCACTICSTPESP